MAFQEFYVNNAHASRSNINGGSGSGAPTVSTTTVTLSGGSWTTITAASGTPFSGVSTGEWVSFFLDGATKAQTLGRVTSVDGGGSGLTVAAWVGGTAPTGTTADDRVRVGGVWDGPSGSVKFPFDFITASHVDASSNLPRVNIKSGTTYSISTGITTNTGPILFCGYYSTPGDLGMNGSTFAPAVIDAGGNSITIVTCAAVQHWEAICVQNNGSTGTTYRGFSHNVMGCTFRRCVAANIRGDGWYSTSSQGNTWWMECEAYSCANHGVYATYGPLRMLNCYFHDNAQAGIYGGGSGNWFSRCVCESNTNDGLLAIDNVAANTSLFVDHCDFWNNGRDGIRLGNTNVTAITIINSNFLKNAGWGINGSGSANRWGAVLNCRFGAGTQANTSGTTTGLKQMIELGNVNYATDAVPWVDPANRDFDMTLSAAQNAGIGYFLDNQSNGLFASYPDMGAVQAQHAAASGARFRGLQTGGRL